MADDDDIMDEDEMDMAAAMSGDPGASGGDDNDGDAENVDFQDLGSGKSAADLEGGEGETHTAHDLEPVFDVPVNVQAVLGKSHLEVSQLLKLGPGAVIELDRKVGEAIDIYVNDRLVARGEVVLIDEHLGITMTEIIKGDRI